MSHAVRTLGLDHNDPSKPSHRLINGTEPSKTIESDGNKIKNHWKTIDSNGQTAEKYSMVMVSSKTIENLQWSLQNHWNLQWFPKNHWTCQWSSQINIILKVWNYPVVTISILIWLVCSKVWISCLDIYCRALQLQTKFTSCQLSFCMLYTVTSSPPESFIRIALLFMTLHFTWCLWHFETFYLLYCVNFTLWNNIRSH